MALKLGDLFGQEIEEERDGSLSSIFAEEPVSLDVFVQDKKFLANPPLSPVQFKAIQHIERIYNPDLYPEMAEEFGGYWSEPVRMTNLVTLQWGKGCKVGTMPIYDAVTGQWTPVADWKGGFVAGATASGEVGIHEASESWISGKGECFRVTTTSGLVEEVYAGHRYLVRGGIDQRGTGRASRKYYSSWKTLRELSVGDAIAVPNTLPEPMSSVEMDPAIVELFGLLLGDGCLPHKGKDRHSVALTVGVEDTAVTQRYTEIVESLGASVTTQRADHRINLYAVGSGGRGNNPVMNLLREHGLSEMGAYEKRVPKAVFSLPTAQVALFLSRLIDTDGHIYTSQVGRVPEVGYTTASRGLADDVQRLILRLGARAQIQSKRVKYRGEIRVYYTVRMRDRSNVLTFCEQISTLSKEDQRLRAISACKDEGNSKTHARLGDLAWDRIVSIEPIGEMDYWDLEVPGVQNYVSNGTLNHNSGKDHVCRVASLRVAYLLLCLKSPQEYYEMPEQDSIHLLNIASNSGQANRAFFAPMTKAVKHSPWFQDKAEPKRDTIQYDKHIEAVSGHSEAEGQEGLNIMLGVADEIDAFKAKDEMVGQGKKAREASTSAESILDMLKTSASTRFPDSYKRVAISFPRYLGSTIQKLTDEARKDNLEMGHASREYFSGPLATWEVNPRVKGKEKFADDYRKDPIASAAKYECKPSRAIDQYFRNVPLLKQAVTEDIQPISIDYTIRDFYSKHTGSTVQGWDATYRFLADFKPIPGARYAIHADMAITGDRAGLAMSHVEKWEERIDKVVDDNGFESERVSIVPIIKNDFVIAYEADISATPSREIQIRWVRNLVFDLIKREFTISRVTYDQFQSADSMQILENHGIETKRVSADLNDDVWKALKDVGYDGRLHMPWNELLFEELEALSRINGKVDHPPGGSKDMADAFACSILGAITAGGQEDPDGFAVSVGTPVFETAEALAPLEGVEFMGISALGEMSMPIGMKGMGY